MCINVFHVYLTRRIADSSVIIIFIDSLELYPYCVTQGHTITIRLIRSIIYRVISWSATYVTETQRVSELELLSNILWMVISFIFAEGVAGQDDQNNFDSSNKRLPSEML